MKREFIKIDLCIKLAIVAIIIVLIPVIKKG